MNIKSFFPQKIKNIYHLGQAILANFVYGFPGRKIHPVKSAESGPASQEFNGVKIIGVTGTNGKTTTVWMIGKILEEAGFKVAINSTINFQIGDKKWVNKTKFTTLSSFAVQKFIKEAVQEKCDYLVLETSSHSLDQFRVWGIPYIVAVITNVTREHLDYHQTMEEYRKAKLKLLQKAETIVVNSDMEKPEYYLDCNTKEKYSYSVKSTNHNVQNTNKIQNPKSKIQKVVAENIELGINYSNYKLLTTNYKLNLPGLFNIENALAATCVGLSQGINLETIKSALEKIKNIPGRMEYVLNDKNLNIIIDYAVTPDSLEKLYKLIKNINTKNKKIIAVFGSCGERDRGKRPIMGEIVARYADYIFVTNEDPYNEDPIQIINEVFSGIAGFEVKGELLKSQISNLKSQTNSNHEYSGQNPKLPPTTNHQLPTKFIEGENCWRILDRREAIKKALSLAQPGDFVVLTGKGAEEIMVIGKNRIPWKEREVVKEELAKL